MIDFKFEDVGIKLPTFQELDEITDSSKVKAIAKFKHEKSGWIWYVIAGEYIGAGDYYCYGLVKGIATEFGMFDLSTALDCGAKFCPTFTPCYVDELVKE